MATTYVYDFDDMKLVLSFDATAKALRIHACSEHGYVELKTLCNEPQIIKSMIRDLNTILTEVENAEK